MCTLHPPSSPTALADWSAGKIGWRTAAEALGVEGYEELLALAEAEGVARPVPVMREDAVRKLVGMLGYE